MIPQILVWLSLRGCSNLITHRRCFNKQNCRQKYSANENYSSLKVSVSSQVVTPRLLPTAIHQNNWRKEAFIWEPLRFLPVVSELLPPSLPPVQSQCRQGGEATVLTAITGIGHDSRGAAASPQSSCSPA